MSLVSLLRFFARMIDGLKTAWFRSQSSFCNNNNYLCCHSLKSNCSSTTYENQNCIRFLIHFIIIYLQPLFSLITFTKLNPHLLLFTLSIIYYFCFYIIFRVDIFNSQSFLTRGLYMNYVIILKVEAVALKTTVCKSGRGGGQQK